MRLYINECVKAFCRRSTIGIFLALTVLNGLLLWFGEKGKEEQLYTASQYKAVYRAVENMSAEDALEMLSARSDELRAIELISFGDNVSYFYKDIDTKALLEKYRKQSLENITSEHGIELRVNRSIQVEGAFGVLKQDYHFRRFLTRGKENVSTEMLLLCFAFNVNKYNHKQRDKRTQTYLFKIEAA